MVAMGGAFHTRRMQLLLHVARRHKEGIILNISGIPNSGKPFVCHGCNGSRGNHIGNVGNSDTSGNGIECLNRIQIAMPQQQAIAQQ